MLFVPSRDVGLGKYPRWVFCRNVLSWRRRGWRISKLPVSFSSSLAKRPPKTSGALCGAHIGGAMLQPLRHLLPNTGSHNYLRSECSAFIRNYRVREHIFINSADVVSATIPGYRFIADGTIAHRANSSTES